MLTRILVVANVLVFAWMEFTGAFESNRTLANHGALVGFLVQEGDWWRIFTGAFLHGGIAHIAFNMIALWQVGQLIEVIYGTPRMAIIYVLSIVGSGIAVTYITPQDVTVGASGAIFGLFGAMAAAGLRMGPAGRELIRQTVPIIAINIGLSFVLPNIAISAHIGGLITGFLVGLIVPLAVRPQPPVAALAAAEPLAESPTSNVP